MKKALEKRGWTVISVDVDQKFKPDVVADIGRWQYWRDLPKEQFAFDLVREGGARERMVIRIETPEAPQQTDRLREFQIIQALQGVVPIPRPLWLDVDGAHGVA